MEVPEIDEHRPDAGDLLFDFSFSALNHSSMPSWDSGNHAFGLQQDRVASAQGAAPLAQVTASVGLMEPPAPRRKPKARTLRERDWEPVKSRVLELVKTETLCDVRAILMRETGFDATERQYKSILNKWNAGKNVHRNEMKAIVHKRQRRVVTEPAKPGYVFELRGEPVPEDKIQRFMKRWELPVDAAYSPTSGAPTPAGGILEYWTPKADPITDGPISPTPLSPVMGREQVTGNSHPSGPFTTASIGATVHAEDNPPHDAVPHPRGPSLALSTITTYLAPDSPFQEQTPRHHSPSTSPSVEEARLFERLETLEAKYGAGSEPIFNVLEEVCQFHFSEGRYQLAETGITKLIAASRRVCGEHDKRTGIALSFLGKILGAQGHYPRAMKTCQEASHILEQTLGPHDESTLSNSLVIGYLFYEMKDYGEAVQLFRPLKDTALRELGPMHSLSVKISMYFSISLITMGEYTEAEQLLESILYGTQGKNPSVPAWVLRRSRLAYGSLLMKTSRCEEAVDIVEEIFYEETAANGRDIPLL